MNSLYTASDARLQRTWAPAFFLLSVAVSSVSALADSSPLSSLVEESDCDDGVCLLQTHTEVKFKPKQSPLPSGEEQGAFEMPEIRENPLITEMNNPTHVGADPEEPEASSRPTFIATPGMSLLTVARESHVLGTLLEIASRNNAADSSQQGFIVIGLIVAGVAVIGSLVICLSLEPSKETYPVQRTPQGSRRPPPSSPQSRLGFNGTSETLERRSHTPGMARGTRETLQRELRGAVSQASSAQSPMSTGATGPSFRGSPMGKSHEAEPGPPRYSISADEEPLCASLVVPHGEAAYLLPDLGHMQRPVEAFDILNQMGTSVLGVVVNDGSEEPGILLHAPRTPDGAGLPLAFIGTSMALCNAGNLPIARPCVDKKHGESFANLSRDVNGGYSVRKAGVPCMRFEGDFVGRCVWLYDKATNQAIGSTRPCGEAYGQIRFELHISAGKDAALAILCLLAIGRLENARATIQSSSQGSGHSLHPDPAAHGGGHGSLLSLGGLQGM